MLYDATSTKFLVLVGFLPATALARCGSITLSKSDHSDVCNCQSCTYICAGGHASECKDANIDCNSNVNSVTIKADDDEKKQYKDADINCGNVESLTLIAKGKEKTFENADIEIHNIGSFTYECEEKKCIEGRNFDFRSNNNMKDIRFTIGGGSGSEVDDLTVRAENADTLTFEVVTGGASKVPVLKNVELYCPENEDYSPTARCKVDLSNREVNVYNTMRIYTKNGFPGDLDIDLFNSGSTYNNVRVYCKDGGSSYTSSCQFNSRTNCATLTGSGCNRPTPQPTGNTGAPTGSTPSPTKSTQTPTDAPSFTRDPTISPTSQTPSPTSSPTSSPTPNPTSSTPSPTEATPNPTSYTAAPSWEPTKSPTSNPIGLTSMPTGPPAMVISTPTSSPTSSPIAGEAFGGSSGQNLQLTGIYGVILIASIGLLMCCALIMCLMMYHRKKRVADKLAKMDEDFKREQALNEAYNMGMLAGNQGMLVGPAGPGHRDTNIEVMSMSSAPGSVGEGGMYSEDEMEEEEEEDELHFAEGINPLG